MQLESPHIKAIYTYRVYEVQGVINVNNSN